jgi:hypothetical protein
VRIDEPAGSLARKSTPLVVNVDAWLKGDVDISIGPCLLDHRGVLAFDLIRWQ